jgi:hypothetical protein
MRRGTGRDAAQLVRGIIANHDQRAHTAHHIAADTADRQQLPDRVRSLLDRRAHTVRAQQRAYRNWYAEVHKQQAERQRWIDRHISRSQDQGLDYGVDL